MNATTPNAQPARIATAAVLLPALAVVTLFAAPSGSDAAAKKRSCKEVVVQFEPEGSGGATKIKVKHIKCKPARKILRKCIGGKLKSGWSGSYSKDRFHLRRQKKRINYLPVGGGGCIPVRGSSGTPDATEHHEKWKWTPNRDAWRCKSDCAPVH